MRKVKAEATLLLLAGVVIVAVLVLPWAIGPGSTGAQQDSMYNCPQPGKWAISVWDGSDGTDTGQALAACGQEIVDVAYYIDPDTQQWLRYVAGQAGFSNLLTLNDNQGMLARGSAAVPGSLPIPGATYSGTTSQGLLMELQVSADGLSITRVKYRATGTEPEGATCEILTTSTASAPIAEGNAQGLMRTTEVVIAGSQGHPPAQAPPGVGQRPGASTQRGHQVP